MCNRYASDIRKAGKERDYYGFDEFECRQWLNATPEQIESIQGRVLPPDALEIVGDDEAAQYVGGYMK
mgnify:FL=1